MTPHRRVGDPFKSLIALNLIHWTPTPISVETPRRNTQFRGSARCDWDRVRSVSRGASRGDRRQISAHELQGGLRSGVLRRVCAQAGDYVRHGQRRGVRTLHAGLQEPQCLRLDRWFSLGSLGEEVTMSISAITNRIAALSRRSAISPKQGIELMRTMFLALVATAIVAGSSPAIAQDREQVKLVFEHALPNVEGKRMAAVLVSYPPGSKSLPHRHAESAFIYAYVRPGPSAARSAMTLRRSITQAGALRNARCSSQRQRERERHGPRQLARGLRGRFQRRGIDDARQGRSTEITARQARLSSHRPAFALCERHA